MNRTNWHRVCTTRDLILDGGICVLVEDQQIAIFNIELGSTEHKLFAIDNFDPISKAAVLSRGIVGSIQNRVVVASPLYKQHFDLETGQCLEQSDVKLLTWPIRLNEDAVEIALDSQ